MTQLKIQKLLQNEEVQKSLNTKEGRLAFVKVTGFKGYLAIYKRDSYTLEFAPFHKTLIELYENIKGFLGILGFRGSAKSTLAEDYAEYCFVTGVSPFTIYLGATDDKSKEALANIRANIEENTLLKNDYELQFNSSTQDEFVKKWSEGTLVMNGRCLLARSTGQKVRGLKFRNTRPTLIIGDDIEDTENTRTKELRTKNRKWFFTELVPATAQGELSLDTKIIIIGNLVHRDCILAHLEKQQEQFNDLIKVKRFPLFDENGEITWKGLYPNMEAVQRQKDKVMIAGEGMGSVIWAREYLLKDADEEDQVMQLHEFQRYTPDMLQKRIIRAGVGLDLAISKKQTADYTAGVRGVDVVLDNGEVKTLILPGILNDRLNFRETREKAKEIDMRMPVRAKWYVESNNYQKAAVETLAEDGLDVEGVQSSTDKRTRLVSACYYAQTGRVLFPETGAEKLIEQIMGFGVEPHDDISDSFTNLVLGMVKGKAKTEDGRIW